MIVHIISPADNMYYFAGVSACSVYPYNEEDIVKVRISIHGEEQKFEYPIGLGEVFKMITYSSTGRQLNTHKLTRIRE